MSALEKIAFFQNRQDEAPNKELAMELAKGRDRRGIREISDNLANPDQRIQTDCLKVLYEIGSIDPSLISEHVENLCGLLKSRNNRLVWGALIGLSTIAEVQSAAIGRHADKIMDLMAHGSVITVDNCVKTLAHVASKEPGLRTRLVGRLVQHLEKCRAKDVPQHSENTLVAIEAGTSEQFIRVLTLRLPELSASQLKRVQKMIEKARRA